MSLYLENLERYICRNLKPGCFRVLLSANLKCLIEQYDNVKTLKWLLWEKLSGGGGGVNVL